MGSLFQIRGLAPCFIRATDTVSGGTTTLTVDDNTYQVFNLSLTSVGDSRSVLLPSAGVKAGQFWIIENRGNFQLFIKASPDASEITQDTGGSGSVGTASIHTGRSVLYALQDTPTTASHWKVAEVFSRYTRTLDSNFTAGTAYMSRNGNIITVTTDGAAAWASSLATRSTSVSFVPLEFRPNPSQQWRIQYADVTGTSAPVMINESNGQISLYQVSSTNLATHVTTTGTNGASISSTYPKLN